MTTFTCPAGHKITTTHPYDRVICEECGIIATHLNTKTGEVWQWTNINEYEEECQHLQDELDAAFDHQYGFDEW